MQKYSNNSYLNNSKNSNDLPISNSIILCETHKVIEKAMVHKIVI